MLWSGMSCSHVTLETFISSRMNVKLVNLDYYLFRPLMGPLLEAVRTGDREAAREWSYLDPWSNLQALIQASTMN